MNKLVRVMTAVAFVLSLFACSASRTEESYVKEADRLMKDSDYIKAAELLKPAIYRYPDSFDLSFAMGKAVVSSSKRFIPGDRGLFLARYYFKRAEKLAKNKDNARDARREYEYAVELQRSAGWK